MNIGMIINSPWFYLLFGSGGVVIVIIAILEFIKKKKSTSNPDININIKIGDNPQQLQNSKDVMYNLQVEKKENAVKMSYEKYSFNSEEFYIQFLSQIEKKKKGRDSISYE